MALQQAKCHSLKSITFTVTLGSFLLRVKSMTVFHMTSVVNRFIFALIISSPGDKTTSGDFPWGVWSSKLLLTVCFPDFWPSSALSRSWESSESRGISCLRGAAECSLFSLACDPVHLIQVCGDGSKQAFSVL